MQFVDRKVELAVLERAYRDPGFAFVPVYGRRRVGKTRLVQKLIRGKEAIYFLADRIAETEHLKGFGQMVGDYFDDPILDEETRMAYFGECKWTGEKVGVNIYEDLMRKSHQVDWHREDRTNRFMLFSRSGFTDAMLKRGKTEDVLLIHNDRPLA